MRRWRDFVVLLVFVSNCRCAAPAPLPDELSRLQGRVIYVDFWASWCAPCRQSFPWMQDLQTRFATDGLTVVAVNVDHDRSAAEAFLRRLHPGFRILFDPQGQWAEQFGVQGMPTSILIDRHGSTRFTQMGFVPADRQAYLQHVEQLLAEH